MHLLDQSVQGSTILAKPEAVINISQTDSILVDKQTGINVFNLLEPNTLEILLEQFKEHERGISHSIETFVEAGRSLFQQLDYHLQTPSNNPLFSTALDYPLSQASFLAPTLSIKTEAVVEAILFTLWASVNRTQYLLSGQIDTIPRDGANDRSALQFIQYPKLMMSILERCRQTCGRRIFAAGAQTSNGIEDLWTYGVDTTAQLEHLCEAGTQLLLTELYVLVKTALLFGHDTPAHEAILAAVSESKTYQVALSGLCDPGMVAFSDLEGLLSEVLFSVYDGK